jgi:Kef-type K+ transport system membrane component KefB
MQASDMQSAAQFLIALGGILLLGLVTDTLGRRTFIPRVTLLLIIGAIIGKDLLNIIPSVLLDSFEIVVDMALLMVGFLLGGKLTIGAFRKSAGQILWISISAAIVTTAIVSSGLIGIGISKEIAILLGCIASATAPAAVFDVVAESRYKGPFSDLLLSIVALDDALALLLFGIGVAVVISIKGLDAGALPVIIIMKEIGGAILLGVLLGLPAAYLTGRIRPGQPILTEALGIVFVCGGLAIMFDVSFLIASMTMGAVIANVAKHHEYPFHVIEGIEWPFMVIFFVLAGASLELSAVRDIGSIGVVYILCRAIGKYLGALLGSHCGKAGKKTKDWMGVALLPQAGVAIGMALVASNHFPEYRQTLLTVIISSTIFFEIIGPVFTRLALQRAENA